MVLAQSLALLAVSSMLAACSPNDAAKATARNDNASDASADAGADACAGPAVVSALDAANYDQSCNTYADCVEVYIGTVTCSGGCACPTAAVSVGASVAVQADYTRAIAQCRPASCSEVPVGCGACYPTLVACVASRCTLIPCGTSDCVGVPEGCSPACSANEVCAAHACHASCTSNADCSGATKCNAATRCLPPPGCPPKDGGTPDGGCSTVCYGYCE